jgi:hypothetical protein
MNRPDQQRCPDAAEWFAFYADAVDAPTAESLREHLSDCSGCLELAQDARQFVTALQTSQAGVVDTKPARSRHHGWLVAAAAVTALLLVPWSLHDTSIEVAIERPLYQPEGFEAPRTEWRDAAGESSFAAAMKHYQAREDRAAERALESHLALHRSDATARFYLAMTRLQLGHDADAIAELTRLIETENHPWRDAARWYRALAWQRTGENARARTEFRAIAERGGAYATQAQQWLERAP